MNSVYIHIPFCNNICAYCDFCKQFYNEELVNKYLNELEIEIKNNYKNELIKTIYIGGGTPSSLNINQLKKLFNIIKIFKVTNDLELTIECNPDVNKEKLDLFKINKVNRISIGIETINEKYYKLLNRYNNKKNIIDKINYIKSIGIDNINVDLMYALPNESIEDLDNDIKFIKSLNVPHISTYSLIIEEHTKLYIDKTKYIEDDIDSNMYDYIIKSLNDYNHYEISNFSKENYESKHNLTYWNNEHYYGFGVGASGYIDNIRYDNTRSITNYLNKNYRINEEILNNNDIIEYELILGLRKLKGININKFKNKYNLNLISICSSLIKKNKLINDGEYIKMNPDYLYIQNSILVELVGVL